MFRRGWIAVLICLTAIGTTACGGPGTAPPSGEEAAAAERASVAAEVRPGIIELRRWREPRQRVLIDRAGVSAGPVGTPLVRKLFVDPSRLQDFLYFVRTYAPFRQKTGSGELAFGGQGPVKAGLVEQRSVFEWVRKVAAEAGGPAERDASYGLVLAWHRGGAVGSCDDVALYLDGEVRASSCAWGEEIRGRLRPEPLARLYAWYDQLQPFQEAAGLETASGQAPARLTFAGQGPRIASADETTALRSLAATLHRELAVRRGGPLPPLTPLPPPASPKTAAATPAPEAPGPSLLVPPTTPAPLQAPQALRPGVMPPPPASERSATIPRSKPSPAPKEDDQSGRHDRHQGQ